MCPGFHAVMLRCLLFLYYYELPQLVTVVPVPVTHKLKWRPHCKGCMKVVYACSRHENRHKHNFRLLPRCTRGFHTFGMLCSVDWTNWCCIKLQNIEDLNMHKHYRLDIAILRHSTAISLLRHCFAVCQSMW
jgi:hypothetical protein